MLVVFADKIPPAVRGKMKLWFIEPVPMVFVSSVGDALAKTVAERLLESCDATANMLIIRSTKEPPGYRIIQKNRGDKLVEMTGLQLVKSATRISVTEKAAAESSQKTTRRGTRAASTSLEEKKSNE